MRGTRIIGLSMAAVLVGALVALLGSELLNRYGPLYSSLAPFGVAVLLLAIELVLGLIWVLLWFAQRRASDS